MAPGASKGPDLDMDRLSEYLYRITREDIRSRDDFGFVEKQAYNQKSYYEVKDEFFSSWPWPFASNHIEPIIPTILDAGVMEISTDMFIDPVKTVVVDGIGKEDKRYSPHISHVMNFQNTVDNELYEVHNLNIFRAYMDGTVFLKTWLDVGDDFKLRHASIPMRLVYKSIRGNGCQRDKCDHITQFIPLTENDWRFRKNLRIGGKKVYDHLEILAPGFEPAESLGAEELRLLQNQITGFDAEQNEDRTMRYMAETSMTYYPPGSRKAIEIIVWWSMRHGLIHRVVFNDDLIRNLADYWFYSSDGWAYQRSLPEILRGYQEKANYTDKQVTDAADIAINPPAYIDKQSSFKAENMLRVPTGMYEVEKGTRVTLEERNIAAIIERGNYLDRIWDKAWQRASLADVQQKVGTLKSDTATADLLRIKQSDKTSRALLNTYNIGFRRTAEIQYELTDRHMPRKMFLDILGSADFVNVNQFFPNAEGGEGLNLGRRFNFSLAGRSYSDKLEEDERTLTVTAEILASPFGQDKAVLWRTMKKRAEINRFREFDTFVPRPPEADVISVEELLQRIESGETEIAPSPLTDKVTIDYQMFRVGAFQRTDRFKNYSDSQRVALSQYVAKLDAIRTMATYAMLQKRAEGDPLFGEALEEVEDELTRQPQARLGVIQ